MLLERVFGLHNRLHNLILVHLLVLLRALLTAHTHLTLDVDLPYLVLLVVTALSLESLLFFLQFLLLGLFVLLLSNNVRFGLSLEVFIEEQFVITDLETRETSTVTTG